MLYFNIKSACNSIELLDLEYRLVSVKIYEVVLLVIGVTSDVFELEELSDSRFVRYLILWIDNDGSFPVKRSEDNFFELIGESYQS